MYLIRTCLKTNKEKVFNLYKRVTKVGGGIARTSNEITKKYINNIIACTQKSGVHLVVDHPSNPKKIIGEIHCYKLVPSVFNHVLSDLTIVVDSDFQGKGIGKLLLNELLTRVENERLDILRVELIVRESNKKAILFYERLGFKIEGRLESRIDSRNGTFEADIPMAWMNKNYKLTM